jgi:hypothetical protein
MSPLDFATPAHLHKGYDGPAVALRADAEAADETPFSVRLDEVRLVNARDRRAHVRRSAAELEWLRLVKLTGGTGFNTTLIDLSESGALIEVDAPLRPGSRLTLEIIGTGRDTTVTLEVVRAYVASLRNGTTFYRGACAFDHHIILPGSLPAPALAASPEPFVGADAALMYLFDRCVGRDGAAASASEPRVTLEPTELLHVLQSIYVRGTRDNRDPAARFIAELLGAILPPLRKGAARDDVMASLETRMQAWPPSLRARLQTTRLHLASLIDRCANVGEAAPGALPRSGVAPEIAAPASDDLLPEASNGKDSTFQRIVVRYLDGGIAKGFTQDFHPSRPQFSLWPSINSTPSERVIVPFANLKAVFFVRDFNGNAARRDQQAFAARAQGRRLEVTFMDTEVILGTTLNYRPDSTGFFVMPADAGGNNTRIFVVCSAIRRVRFL